MSRRRVPGRVSEYLDTSRLDLARTKRYGILMVPDFEDKHPIDVGGWVSKRNAATNTAPATRVVAYRKDGGGDLPLLHTPRSFGTQPYPRTGQSSDSLSRLGIMRASTTNEFARTRFSLVRRPSRLDIDFSFPDAGTRPESESDATTKTKTKKMKKREKTRKSIGGRRDDDKNRASTTTLSGTSSHVDVENPEELKGEADLLVEKAVDADEEVGEEEHEGQDSGSDADSDASDAISTAARDAYPNARSGWEPSARHHAMLKRMEGRHSRRSALELHRGCHGGTRRQKGMTRDNGVLDPQGSYPAFDLSVGRAAFDPSYNHACPISIYKSRRERNSRYGFRFN